MAEFIDDTPRTVAIYPETAQQRAAREQARLEELGLAPPPAANKRPRGRPVGARDSVQRVRRPASEAEKAKIRRSIQQNKAYQGIVRQHEEKS